MIVDERFVTFINSLNMGNTPLLEEIEREAHAQRIPVIRREMQSLLKFLLAAKRPKRILEVGTAVGFSALLMAEYAPEPCRITTIENYEKRIPVARENFSRAGKTDSITLLEGDAAEILKGLDESYDLIFMDVRMPIMDGHEATRAIRALDRDDAKTIPIVAMSANAFASDIITSRQSGMNEHIIKPLNFNSLVACMDRWLGNNTPPRKSMVETESDIHEVK